MKEGRLLGALLYLGGVLCLALAVHIATILALPFLAGEKAMMRWAAFATPGHPGLPPSPTASGTGAPFEDPALVQGLCLFDLSERPFRLDAEIKGMEFVSFSFHRPSGESFYAVTDRAAQHGRIHLLLLDQQQFDDLESDSEDVGTDHTAAAAGEDLRIIAPDQSGFILIRALVTRPSQRDEIKNWMQTIQCRKADEASR